MFLELKPLPVIQPWQCGAGSRSQRRGIRSPPRSLPVFFWPARKGRAAGLVHSFVFWQQFRFHSPGAAEEGAHDPGGGDWCWVCDAGTWSLTLCFKTNC